MSHDEGANRCARAKKRGLAGTVSAIALTIAFAAHAQEAGAPLDVILLPADAPDLLATR